MPKVYRGMFAATDGRPSVANDKNSLGVTAAADRPSTASADWAPDVEPDGDGVVGPGRGMSVAPTAADLPSHRLPKRLTNRGIPKARGSDKLCVWSHGSGPFESSAVTVGLSLRPDAANHGLVEPADRMPLDAYRQRLADTTADWEVDEP